MAAVWDDKTQSLRWKETNVSTRLGYGRRFNLFFDGLLDS